MEPGNLHSSLLNPTSLPPNMVCHPTSRTNLATGKPEPKGGGATVAGTSSSYEPRLISKNGDDDDDGGGDSMFQGYWHIYHLVLIITITNHLHILPPLYKIYRGEYIHLNFSCHFPHLHIEAAPHRRWTIGLPNQRARLPVDIFSARLLIGFVCLWVFFSSKLV